MKKNKQLLKEILEVLKDIKSSLDNPQPFGDDFDYFPEDWIFGENEGVPHSDDKDSYYITAGRTPNEVTPMYTLEEVFKAVKAWASNSNVTPGDVEEFLYNEARKNKFPLYWWTYKKDVPEWAWEELMELVYTPDRHRFDEPDYNAIGSFYSDYSEKVLISFLAADSVYARRAEYVNIERILDHYGITKD